jgi:hypothetical protein
MTLLQIGRHSRQANGDKTIVARNENEGARLEALARPEDHLLIPVTFPGPTVLLQGTDLSAAAATLMRYVRKATDSDATITHRHDNRETTIPAPAATVTAQDDCIGKTDEQA